MLFFPHSSDGKKLLNAGFLGVVHISLIFVYGMQFILYGLGDALNAGKSFCPGGTATSAASGAFFGGSPFRLAYRPFHYQHVESFFCEHFGLDRIRNQEISRIVSA